MLKAYKYRIYPNKEQRIFFAKTFGCVRFVYNKMLADRINSYKESQQNVDKSIKYPTPAQYKTEFPFLKEVDSLALANAQINLDKAYANFFRDKIVEKIRAELLEEGNVEFNTIVLVLFLERKKMLKDYFSEYERKALKQKIEQLHKEEIFVTIKSIDKTIKNMEASIVAMSAASTTY